MRLPEASWLSAVVIGSLARTGAPLRLRTSGSRVLQPGANARFERNRARPSEAKRSSIIAPRPEHRMAEPVAGGEAGAVRLAPVELENGAHRNA